MSAETYERLVEAGAPRLNPGYFYRVRLSRDGSRVEVEIRTRLRWGGSALVDLGVGRLQGLDDPEKVLPYVARVARAVAEHASAQAERSPVREALDALTGDHP